ncbi:MAG: DUF1641 domain-containing protein [Cephaloticoccus sp.]|nr:DUF1641 domain-containing protein [Cephaloticoccus sp.]MCF7761123.1 DUF1641 domain-containing protein [Cephaloticoccus sp.]
MNATDNPALAERLDALDRKLDLVLAEVEGMRRIRREVEELQEDFTRVGKDLFSTAVAELDEVAPFIATGDFTALLKRVIRNTNNLNELLVQVESSRDLLHDATPLARELFSDGLAKLDELDRKGYFAMARELGHALDNVVTHFTPEDARRLADNIVVMLETFKNLTQPEMLLAVNNAMEIYRKLDFAKMEEVTLWKAFRELNKPEMRRALGFLLSFLRNLAEHPVMVSPASNANLTSTQKS